MRRAGPVAAPDAGRARPDRCPPPAPPRDGQRTRLYEAERWVHRVLDRAVDFPVVDIAGSKITVPAERRFGDVAAVQRYLDQVRAHPGVLGAHPRAAAPVTVRERAGQTAAHYERATATIALPPRRAGRAWALRESVVLHEFAHHLAADDEPGHGPAFAGRLLELIELLVGPEVALLLRVAYADNAVRVG